MFWDLAECEAPALVKTDRSESERKVFQTEALSAFGSTDIGASDTIARALSSENLAEHDRCRGGVGRQRRDAAPRSPRNASISSVSTEGQRKVEEHQRSLPKLPIPSLDHTCDLYLKSLEGILNAEEFEISAQHVTDFRKPGGLGEMLQERLLRRNEDERNVSWFEDFWDDAYLCARDPIPININYFFGIEQHPRPECRTQIGRAGSLLFSAVDIYTRTRDGDLATDTERGKPLCMSQYRRVFCASRVPGKVRDKIVTFTNAPLFDSDRRSRTSEYKHEQPRHAVVMMRNRMFVFNVLNSDPVAPMPLSQEAITQRIAFVVAECTKTSSNKGGPPIGVFTTLHRTEWFEIHESLRALGKNETNLRLLRSAIMVVCLDTIQCDDLGEAARLFLHGTGTNRWFDRHNLIVTANGCAGVNFEHSVGDGATTLRVVDTMFRHDAAAAPTATEVEQLLRRVTSADDPTLRNELSEAVEELDWTLDMPLDRAMKTAFDEFLQLIQSNETTVLHFSNFGGDFVKKNKMSPDAFVQVAFQLAYHRLFGRNDATYEAASTRGFLHGRTEVVRSVTRAAVDFCQAAATSPLFARRIGSKIPSLQELLRDAIAEHVSYMSKAKAALGVDRHLLGLRLACAESGEPLPAIFADPAFAKASHWNLSTSHCGSSALNLFGFGPVVFDGFGLGYMIKNDSIDVVITSKYTHQLTSSTIFADMLESTLLQMKCIVNADPAKRKVDRGVSSALHFQHPTAVADFEYEPTKGFSYKTAKVGKSLYAPGGGRSLIAPSHNNNRRSAFEDAVADEEEDDSVVF